MESGTGRVNIYSALLELVYTYNYGYIYSV